MAAQIIDGREVADRIRAEIAHDSERFQAQYGYAPGLGVILAGPDPASAQYVRMKRNACEQVGITSIVHDFDASCTQEQVDSALESLNSDPQVHGILVQLPLFDHLDEQKILRAVRLDKDVDGFHPINIGRLAMKGLDPMFTPATPTGCMVLLEEAGVSLSGANAVVVGRSNIVGMPMALMLIKANATVTVVHSRTRDIPAMLRDADVVIAAVGRANMIQGDWLKPGAVVIDVGTNRIEDPSDRRGYRWVGDVDLESALPVVKAITKVPGGVGPMTITILLQNTMKAAWRIAEAEG